MIGKVVDAKSGALGDLLPGTAFKLPGSDVMYVVIEGVTASVRKESSHTLRDALAAIGSSVMVPVLHIASSSVFLESPQLEVVPLGTADEIVVRPVIKTRRG